MASLPGTSRAKPGTTLVLALMPLSCFSFAVLSPKRAATPSSFSPFFSVWVSQADSGLSWASWLCRLSRKVCTFSAGSTSGLFATVGITGRL